MHMHACMHTPMPRLLNRQQQNYLHLNHRDIGIYHSLHALVWWVLPFVRLMQGHSLFSAARSLIALGVTLKNYPEDRIMLKKEERKKKDLHPPPRLYN